VVGPLNPPERIVFTGQVNILDGEFSYFNRKFLIKNGTIENSSPYVLDPKYEIDAEATVDVKISEQETKKKVKITLKLTGTLQSPQAPVLEAEVTDPTQGKQYNFDKMERREILFLLAFGNIPGQAGDVMSSYTSETATNFLMRQAESFVGGSQIASKLNLRELQLNINDKEGSSRKFSIITDISSQLAVTYMSTYSLSAKPYLLGIEYKLKKNVSVAGTRDEYGKYGVDLKYGIEW